MPLHRSTLTRPLVAVAMVVASSLYALAQQPPTPSRVRGTIEGVDGDVLSVKSRSGEDFKLHMTGDMRVAGIVKISLSDIKVGSFVGATHGARTGWQPERGRSACVFRKTCAALAKARGPTICAPIQA